MAVEVTRLSCSLKWIAGMLMRVSSSHEAIPHLLDPFTADGQLSSQLVSALTHPSVYTAVLLSILPDERQSDFSSLIHTLARHGVYVLEDEGSAVNHSVLSQTNPFSQTSHVAVIEGLMSLYTHVTVSVPHIVSTVRRISKLVASKDLPSGLSEGLVLWLNKVSQSVVQARRAEMDTGSMDARQRRRHLLHQRHIPNITNLTEGLNDGQCLGALLVHYIPQCFKWADFHFGKQPLTKQQISENLSKVISFLTDNLEPPGCHIEMEAMLQDTYYLDDNFQALVAHLYHSLEVKGSLQQAVNTGITSPRQSTSDLLAGKARILSRITASMDDGLHRSSSENTLSKLIPPNKTVFQAPVRDPIISHDTGDFSSLSQLITADRPPLPTNSHPQTSITRNRKGSNSESNLLAFDKGQDANETQATVRKVSSETDLLTSTKTAGLTEPNTAATGAIERSTHAVMKLHTSTPTAASTKPPAIKMTNTVHTPSTFRTSSIHGKSNLLTSTKTATITKSPPPPTKLPLFSSQCASPIMTEPETPKMSNTNSSIHSNSQKSAIHTRTSTEETDFTEITKSEQDPASPDVETRRSFTIDSNQSLPSAIAAGLPIINGSKLQRQTHITDEDQPESLQSIDQGPVVHLDLGIEDAPVFKPSNEVQKLLAVYEKIRERHAKIDQEEEALRQRIARRVLQEIQSQTENQTTSGSTKSGHTEPTVKLHDSTYPASPSRKQSRSKSSQSDSRTVEQSAKLHDSSKQSAIPVSKPTEKMPAVKSLNEFPAFSPIVPIVPADHVIHEAGPMTRMTSEPIPKRHDHTVSKPQGPMASKSSHVILDMKPPQSPQRRLSVTFSQPALPTEPNPWTAANTQEGQDEMQRKQREQQMRARLGEREKARKATQEKRRKAQATQRVIKELTSEVAIEHTDKTTHMHYQLSEQRSHPPSPVHKPPEYLPHNGPDIYAPPRLKSNKKLIKNAISFVCLAGDANLTMKQRALGELESCSASHVMVLFRDIIGFKFRGLYSYSPDLNQANRVFGSGPKVIKSSMVAHLYKYNSGRKEFREIPSRSFSVSVDALTIQSEYWTRKTKPSARK